MEYVLVLPGAYLLGSIPWGLIAGRIRRGIDVRQYGSGSTGMTNVMRTLGPGVALLVLLGDVSKGVSAILLSRLLSGGPSLEALAATLAVAGHNWPVYSGFRGGRGIATGVGGLLTLSPVSGLIAIGVFLLPVAVTRLVSLGSILAVLSAMVTIPLFVAAGGLPWQYIVYVAVAGSLIIWQHRGNIRRLLRGTERRLGQRVDPPSGGDQGTRENP